MCPQGQMAEQAELVVGQRWVEGAVQMEGAALVGRGRYHLAGREVASREVQR